MKSQFVGSLLATAALSLVSVTPVWAEDPAPDPSGLPEWSGSVLGGGELTWPEIKRHLEFASISLGSNYAVATDTDGFAWSWGVNGYGQLCNPEASGPMRYVGYPIPYLDQSGEQARPASVTAGDMASYSIDDSGGAWACGSNTFGELGNPEGAGTSQVHYAPSPVVNESGQHMKFSRVFGIFNYAFGAAEDGSTWGWGINGYGQLANPDTGKIGFWEGSAVAIPTLDGSGTQARLSDIAGDQSATVALGTDGRAWAWGNRGMNPGMLGAAEPDPETPYAPTPIVDEDGHQLSFASLSAGYDFVLALDSQGQAWTWGKNSEGQFGNERVAVGEVSAYPIPVLDAQGDPIIFSEVHASAANGYGITEDGSVLAWGSNRSGQLGNPTVQVGGVSQIPVPVRFGDGTALRAVSLAADGGYAVAIAQPDASGLRRTWSWGDNSFGQLGVEVEDEFSNVPVELTLPQPTPESRIFWGEDDVEGSAPVRTEHGEAVFAVPAHAAGRIPVYYSVEGSAFKQLVGHYTFRLNTTLSIAPSDNLSGTEATASLAVPEAEVPYLGQARFAIEFPEGLEAVTEGDFNTVALGEDGSYTFSVVSTKPEQYTTTAQAYVTYQAQPTRVFVSDVAEATVRYKEEENPAPTLPPSPAKPVAPSESAPSVVPAPPQPDLAETGAINVVALIAFALAAGVGGSIMVLAGPHKRSRHSARR